PFTVFAPVDDVFNVHTVGALLGSARLEGLLHHFIVPGKYTSADLRRLRALRTVSGYPLAIVSRDGIEVGGAMIIKPDVPYDKGMIHEIDQVVGTGGARHDL
ncbi:MAG TPA: fasciclin domain-containing protein, partial [Methanocella sp.]|nr:fasciclin domain-containing protein [Methanocella sp.]